ncbi:hypothetical protein [Flavobacterium foetidum]|uniref:hypothetical protein n=1 Tax=Flavobacterium foetidum TaxID=2026681 RepID=UPI0010753C74|nr:hypothetical protein [Flavobacterium foetidum]KAF2516100.1 hypothetical protein E0W73_07545 [Flavobacterium foetidum]
MNKPYQYHFRPGYHSDKLLIDIFLGAERETFNNDFLHSIASLKPHMIEVLDLWMNDEILLHFDSEAGKFSLSKDVWGLAFVTADENQDGLKKIDLILQQSDLFEKIEVDFDRYK